MEIVYVLTNPTMPGLVKIGKTKKTIKNRLRELDSTGVPHPFDCVAAWEFQDAKEVESTLHQAFEDRRVRPNREFFEISPHQPIAILEQFGIKDVAPKEDVNDGGFKNRRENFKFNMVGIKPGSTLTSVWDEKVTCEVVNDSKVMFKGKTTSLSDAANSVLLDTGKNWQAVSGPDSWKYEGKVLRQIRDDEEM